MGLKEKIYSFAADLFFERPVKGKSYADLSRLLDDAGKSISARLDGKKHTEFNHRVLTHIIGIERWGQSRLRTLLGAPLIQEEYTAHRPPRDIPWADLIEQFRATRAESVALAAQLESASVGPDKTAPHNQFGPLTARGWLRYLRTHASREIMRVR